MSYKISELYTDVIQGEGLHSGFPCSVLRFGTCNLWPDALKLSPTCPWCDTAVLHRYDQMDFDILMSSLDLLTTGKIKQGLIVTGGEPLMQLDQRLLDALASKFLWLDIETNGTLPFDLTKPSNAFISCSPKTSVLRVAADWYKVLIPHKENMLDRVREHALANNAPIYVQPVEIGGYNSAITKENIEMCIKLCTQFGFRLSLQVHKIIGVR